MEKYKALLAGKQGVSAEFYYSKFVVYKILV